MLLRKILIAVYESGYFDDPAYPVERTQVASGSLEISIPIDDGASQSLELLRRLDDQRLGIADFSVRRPTLDDAFLALTGAHAPDQEGAPA